MPLGQGKRSSAIRPSEWQRHREKICELYETKSLEKVQAVMLKHHEFAPTLSQYKRQLSLWKVSKNRRRPEAEDAGLPHEPTEMAEKNEDFEDTYVRLFLLSIEDSQADRLWGPTFDPIKILGRGFNLPLDGTLGYYLQRFSTRTLLIIFAVLHYGMESAGHLFNSCKNDTKAYIGGNYGPIHLAIVIIKKDLLDLDKIQGWFALEGSSAASFQASIPTLHSAAEEKVSLFYDGWKQAGFRIDVPSCVDYAIRLDLCLRDLLFSGHVSLRVQRSQ